MRGWWEEISGLVLPVDCAGCGRPRTGLCEACRAALGGPGPRRVRPDPVPPGLPAVYAAAEYADEVRALLLAHKERGALWLARPLGRVLAAAVRTAAPPAPHGPLTLVPVPSARRSVAVRGQDATRRLALGAARELCRDGGRARVLPVLRQARVVDDQVGLGARERTGNLSGALVTVRGGGRLLAAAPVVLVDDLMTTGASLAAAALAVEVAGGLVTGAAVVAGPPGANPRDGAHGGRANGSGSEGERERNQSETEAELAGSTRRCSQYERAFTRTEVGRPRGCRPPSFGAMFGCEECRHVALDARKRRASG